jgi:hypothetical protein
MPTRKLTGFFLVWLILFTPDLWASETLLYAIRYESLQRYPDVVNTKVYSVDPNNAKETRVVFSDENTPIMLLPKRGMPGHPGEVLVSSRKKIFAHAVEKRLNPGRWYASKASIYELSSDGFRRVFDVMGEQSLSEIFANHEGTKIGYLNYEGQKMVIFIHETETGRLLNKIDVSKVFLDCFASSIGWLQDGDRLSFTLDTGDVHVTSEESDKQKGTYTMRGDGTGIMKLPENLTSFPLEKGSRRGTDSPPQFIGELTDGSYVFRDLVVNKGHRGHQLPSFLYQVNPLTKSRKEIPLGVSIGLSWFKVSPTGKYIAFTEKISSKEGRYEWVEHLWVKDLASGKVDKVFTLDNMPFKGQHLGLVGWKN